MSTNRREQEKAKARKSNAMDWAKKQDKGSGPTSIKLPQGIEMYKPSLGINEVDFMPHIVGEGAFNKYADVGFEHFELTYGVHRIPGLNGRAQWHCCLFETFKKKCPVCIWRNNHAKTEDPQLIKDLMVSTRHLWLINDKPGDEKNPLKLWDTNHFNRGQGFGEQMGTAIITTETHNFSDLQTGKKVRLNIVEGTWPGGKYEYCSRIDFMDRKYKYSDAMLENAPCLEEIPIELPYDELNSILTQEEAPAHSSSSSVVGNGKPAEDKVDDETPFDEFADSTTIEADKADKEEETTEEEEVYDVDDMVMYKKKKCKVVKVSGDGTSLILKDAEDNVYRAVDPMSVDRIEDKEETEEETVDDEDPFAEEEPKKPTARKR